MATITTLTEGHMEPMIKQITAANFTALLADCGTVTSLTDVGGYGLDSFRTICNANFAAINTGESLSLTIVDLLGGESWQTIRTKLNTTMAQVNAALNP